MPVQNIGDVEVNQEKVAYALKKLGSCEEGGEHDFEYKIVTLGNGEDERKIFWGHCTKCLFSVAEALEKIPV